VSATAKAPDKINPVLAAKSFAEFIVCSFGSELIVMRLRRRCKGLIQTCRLTFSAN
jgi:hypothetical protein